MPARTRDRGRTPRPTASRSTPAAERRSKAARRVLRALQAARAAGNEPHVGAGKGGPRRKAPELRQVHARARRSARSQRGGRRSAHRGAPWRWRRRPRKPRLPLRAAGVLEALAARRAREGQGIPPFGGARRADAHARRQRAAEAPTSLEPGAPSAAHELPPPAEAVSPAGGDGSPRSAPIVARALAAVAIVLASEAPARAAPPRHGRAGRRDHGHGDAPHAHGMLDRRRHARLRRKLELYDRLSGTFTWLPAVGARDRPRRNAVSHRQPPGRADVRIAARLSHAEAGRRRRARRGELNGNLIDLGYDPYGAIGDHEAFGEATAAAVRAGRRPRACPRRAKSNSAGSCSPPAPAGSPKCTCASARTLPRANPSGHRRRSAARRNVRPPGPQPLRHSKRPTRRRAARAPKERLRRSARRPRKRTRRAKGQIRARRKESPAEQRQRNRPTVEHAAGERDDASSDPSASESSKRTERKKATKESAAAARAPARLVLTTTSTQQLVQLSGEGRTAGARARRRAGAGDAARRRVVAGHITKSARSRAKRKAPAANKAAGGRRRRRIADDPGDARARPSRRAPGRGAGQRRARQERSAATC